MSTEHTANGRRRTMRAALWLPGMLVALGAAVATAHGLYEVALAAACPPLIAALYPLITDGLALVAYAATARLSGSARRYAWGVVVLAAGLSGLAQASYLAHGVASASAELRFGVGAWPAIAAAIVAHLLYLIAHEDHGQQQNEPHAESNVGAAPDRANPDEATANQPAPDVTASSELDECPTVQFPAVQAHGTRTEAGPVQPPSVQPFDSGRDSNPVPVSNDRSPSSSIQSLPSRPAASPARDKADRAANTYRSEHGQLPTVARLMDLADVSRGTAGEALKVLRTQPAELHVVHEPTHQEAHQ